MIVWSDLWFKSCTGLWSWMAQVTPGVTPGATPVPGAAGAPSPTAAVPPGAASPPPMGSGTPLSFPVPGGDAGPIMNGTVPAASHSLALTFLHGFALVLYLVICVALIICVMFQTTKSEGLSGVIGGSTSSSLFRGKKSSEETMTMWTSRLAVAFIVFSFLIWLMFGRTSF